MRSKRDKFKGVKPSPTNPSRKDTGNGKGTKPPPENPKK